MEAREGAKVWIPSEGEEVWASGAVVSRDESGTTVEVDGKTAVVPTLNVHFKNPDSDDGMEDMIRLNYLNEPALLHNIKFRYQSDHVYTYTGRMCIAVNPFKWMPELYTKEVMDQYEEADFGDMSPHVFATASHAYKTMKREQLNQSIVVSGESGAGKTETAKIVMLFLAHAGSGGGSEQVAQQVLQSNPLLEAFGNAKTLRNDNSSRFGKFTNIQFDQYGRVIGAKTNTYLLEKSRVVRHTDGERNYHIFYQLCAGLGDEERATLKVREMGESGHKYVGVTDTTMIEGRSDKDMLKATFDAMSIIGMSEDEQSTIKSILAAILHLGDTEFSEADGGEACSVTNTDTLATATSLLGVTADALTPALTNRKITMRNESYLKPLTAEQAFDTRDALSKSIYGHLFDWIVARINKSIQRDEQVAQFIGLLDIFGFESFKVNSFEQLCINYANEKLQQQFTHDIFRSVQEEYTEEGITWSQVDFIDNQECLDLIEMKLGILSMLDEECNVPKGSDESFAQKIRDMYGKDHKYLEAPKLQRNAFTVLHYAGPVTYESAGFLDKNRDKVQPELLEIMAESTNPFIRALYEADVKALAPPPAAAPGKKATSKAVTIGSRFKSQLADLMKIISQTEVQYIRCIKPNTKNKAGMFEALFVSNQLRYCGVLEVIRISRAAYPHRMPHANFCKRFEVLANGGEWSWNGDVNGPQTETCRSLIALLVPDDTKYQVGKTRVYMRAGIIEDLEERRREALGVRATILQRHVRGFLCRSRYTLYRRKALIISSFARMVPRKTEYLKMKAAAIKMQCGMRKALARMLFTRLKRDAAATYIQKVARGRVRRIQYEHMRAAATRIQARTRMRQQRSRFLVELAEAREEAKMENQLKALRAKLEEEQRAREELEAKLKAGVAAASAPAPATPAAAVAAADGSGSPAPSSPLGSVAGTPGQPGSTSVRRQSSQQDQGEMLGEAGTMLAALEEKLKIVTKKLESETLSRKQAEADAKAARHDAEQYRYKLHLEQSTKRQDGQSNPVHKLEDEVKMHQQQARVERIVREETEADLENAMKQIRFQAEQNEMLVEQVAKLQNALTREVTRRNQYLDVLKKHGWYDVQSQSPPTAVAVGGSSAEAKTPQQQQQGGREGRDSGSRGTILGRMRGNTPQPNTPQGKSQTPVNSSTREGGNNESPSEGSRMSGIFSMISNFAKK